METIEELTDFIDKRLDDIKVIQADIDRIKEKLIVAQEQKLVESKLMSVFPWCIQKIGAESYSLSLYKHDVQTEQYNEWFCKLKEIYMDRYKSIVIDTCESMLVIDPESSRGARFHANNVDSLINVVHTYDLALVTFYLDRDIPVNDKIIKQLAASNKQIKLVE